MDRSTGSSIVVTGAGGFVGRALAERLTASQRLLLVDHVPFAYPKQATALVGDLRDAAVMAAIVASEPDTVFHLAAVPGGAAEADPALSRRVNLDASLALLALLATLANAPRRPRLIYASSIAVFGVPLPEQVDDDTVAQPSMTYGAHKLMVEIALADAARRGELTALALRLPGIVARPVGPSGLKSAFLSDLFHSLRAKRPITLPVGPDGRVWIASLARCIDNLVAAAAVDLTPLGQRTAVTMSALHARIDELVAAVAARTGADPALVDYAPNSALTAQFAAYPPLATPAAASIGLADDGDLDRLVARTLDGLSV